jgi:hypothetical protein
MSSEKRIGLLKHWGFVGEADNQHADKQCWHYKQLETTTRKKMPMHQARKNRERERKTHIEADHLHDMFIARAHTHKQTGFQTDKKRVKRTV